MALVSQCYFFEIFDFFFLYKHGIKSNNLDFSHSIASDFSYAINKFLWFIFILFETEIVLHPWLLQGRQ